MLSRQIILPRPSPTKLTPLLRYSCKLFPALSLEGFAPENVNSFGIKQIQALSAKHPSGGISASSTLQSFQYANSLPCHTYAKRARKSNHCHTSKIALPQVLSLPHIRKTGGVPSITVNQPAQSHFLRALCDLCGENPDVTRFKFFAPSVNRDALPFRDTLQLE